MNTPNTEITLWIEFRRLVLGLPSVVIATGAIFLVTQEHRTRADLIGDYQWAAATAMRGQDWDKADVYYRKLAWLHETDVATQYGLALVAEQQGDHDRARGLMSDIAPDDSAGFGPAHFWLARDLVRRTNRKPPAPNVLETLERHLLRTVERQPDHASAHVMLGRFYRGQGRVKRVRELFEKAAWHLAKVTPGYPKYRLELAALYRILGNAAQAESLAEASGDHFQQELDADRNDIEARLGLAAAQVFLHRFSEALGTLEDGPDPRGAEPIRKALVATWLAWVNALDPAQESLVGKRLELLQQAIQLDPENPIVLNNLAHLTMLSGPAADKARGELKDVLATGRAPAVVHLTLGSIAIKQQKLDQAEYHLNQAFEMNPRMPEVLNNLAWVVAPPRRN